VGDVLYPRGVKDSTYALDDNTHVMMYRDVPTVFAHPRCAAEVKQALAVVYDYAAYTNDPDVIREKRYISPNYTHVLVALLTDAEESAAKGSSPSYQPMTLIHNIAGGNQNFIPKTVPVKERLPWALDHELQSIRGQEFDKNALMDDCDLLERIIKLARATEEHAKKWMVVADPENA
jgi:hypothetical protein